MLPIASVLLVVELELEGVVPVAALAVAPEVGADVCKVWPRRELNREVARDMGEDSLVSFQIRILRRSNGFCSNGIVGTDGRAAVETESMDVKGS